MGLPKAREARSFYRCAMQRFEDAEYLLEAGRTTGAVYLAGYGVECILKALIIDSAAKGSREDISASFRGARAHDFEWLKALYVSNRGANFPRPVRECFVLVSTWSTDFRYRAGSVNTKDSVEFLEAANGIIIWADGRM